MSDLGRASAASTSRGRSAQGTAEDTVAFLAARMLAHQEYRRPRCYGISSDALALYGVGAGPRPRTPGWTDKGSGCSWRWEECGHNHPHDAGDLEACELTYRMAPPDVQARMLPVLEEFRAWVNDGLNRYGASYPWAEPVSSALQDDPV